jgi:hypothetical protein
MTSTKAFKMDFYTVTIDVDGRAYIYPCFCLNHGQALEASSAAHIAACGLLPLPTSIKVDGPCHESGCDCGLPCQLECVQCTETDDLGLTN